MTGRLYLQVYREGQPAEKIGSWRGESPYMADFDQQQSIGWHVLFALQDKDVSRVEVVRETEREEG